MELMLKLAAGAVMAALCAVILRKNAGEFGVLVMLVIGVWILGLSVESVSQAVDSLSRLARLAQLKSELFLPVIKVVALSLITRVTCEVCRSAGESGIAAFVEVSGTFLALGAALPLVNGVVDMMAEMLV